MQEEKGTCKHADYPHTYGWYCEEWKPLDYHPNDDLDDPASMEGSYRPEYAGRGIKRGS